MKKPLSFARLNFGTLVKWESNPSKPAVGVVSRIEKKGFAYVTLFDNLADIRLNSQNIREFSRATNEDLKQSICKNLGKTSSLTKKQKKLLKSLTSGKKLIHS